MVPRERAGLAREGDVAVRDEELRLADAAGEEDQLARARIARRVLRPDPDVELAHRDPAALAAPAHVDDLRLQRQHLSEGRDRRRRGLLLEARCEVEAAGRDLQHQLIFAPWAIHAPSNRRSASVMCVAFSSGIR